MIDVVELLCVVYALSLFTIRTIAIVRISINRNAYIAKSIFSIFSSTKAPLKSPNSAHADAISSATDGINLMVYATSSKLPSPKMLSQCVSSLAFGVGANISALTDTVIQNKKKPVEALARSRLMLILHGHVIVKGCGRCVQIVINFFDGFFYVSL